jgi:MFS transporter, ACS family, allantoate permease
LVRNYVPWIIIGISYLINILLLLAIRYFLAKENKLRDKETPDDRYIDVYVEIIDSDGKKARRMVDKVRNLLLQTDVVLKNSRHFWT